MFSRVGFVGAVLATIVLLPVMSFAVLKPGPESDHRRHVIKGSAAPAHRVAAHRIGRLELAVANNGTFGHEYHPGPSVDAFTGQQINASCQYPKNSNVHYLFGGAFWIGAVVGRDTLVSVGADGWQWTYEMYPDESPFGEMEYRSIKDPTSPRYEGAISEEDYISVYYDTLTTGVPADFFGRPHRPLNIEVRQASYAWSYAYAEDFVLFDYQIKNIGSEELNSVYMGIYVDCMVCYDCFGNTIGYTDDHCGFLHTFSTTSGSCEFLDTISTAWIADDDGDLERIFEDGSRHPCPHVTGARIVRTPAESLDVSFNWWISNTNSALDFGPRERAETGRLREEWRDFRTGGVGTPEGDANKYYQLRNREFDYNQVYTASIGPADSLWMLPDQEQAENFADGYDARYLLSFGPFDIHPGQTLPISFAYVAGENLHQKIDNAELFLPHQPDKYYSNLDFSDLAQNARWAGWIYDNPGVDTDGDDDFGKFRECCDTAPDLTIVCDTTWYEGDGVPDFRGAAPPPAPELWVERPEDGTLRIRWNGLRTETTRDVFSRIVDFEGYRVYYGRDARGESFGLLASYDLENYNKYVFDTRAGEYRLFDAPFTLRELRCLYADDCNDDRFNPLEFDYAHPFTHPQHPESVFVFRAQDYNASGLGGYRQIAKVYPDASYPTSLDPNAALPEELTPEGRLKYFEYEYLLTDLLPTVSYLVNVTAFDFGSPQSGLPSLETSITDGALSVFPTSESNDEVYVYPNPYRIDGGYRTMGFEGRATDDSPSRTHAVHFANLPPKCTIRIFSLDGDLVRELDHDEPPGSGHDSHETWNLITRNTQLAVSGLYYWTVESPSGDVQIGKLVLIM